MKKLLFIDRDGTIVSEPEDEQLDSIEKLRFLKSSITTLKSIAEELNFELVMVTNQDGLGTDAYPESDFYPIQNLILSILESEGIRFSAVHVDRSFPEDKRPTRKPGIGMLEKYLSKEYDIAGSFVIGDRMTDMELARNLGCKGILIKEDSRNLGLGETKTSDDQIENSITLTTDSWKKVYEFLKNKDRVVSVERVTNETSIRIKLNPDGNGLYSIETGLGFFDHMLEQLSRHGGMDLDIKVSGDLHIDEHHTIEDTAIALGSAFLKALDKKVGMERYGYQLPMDDCQANVSLDFGGRSWLEWKAEFKREKIGEMPTEMFYHFFKSFSDESRCNLHIEATGVNEHHKIESIFKAFARAIKMAVRREAGSTSLPTTKGKL